MDDNKRGKQKFSSDMCVRCHGKDSYKFKMPVAEQLGKNNE